MSNYQGGVGPEVFYSEAIAGTALATFTTEASLMGAYPIPQIPATFFKALGQVSSTMKIRAYGNAGDTTTAPTFTLSARLLTSSTSWSAGGLLLGSTPAITMTGTSVTNGWWQLDADVILTAIAAGAATSSLTTIGTVSGVLSGMMPAANVSAVNATFDNTGATQYYLWLSAACGTSNAANKIQLQMLKVYLEN